MASEPNAVTSEDSGMASELRPGPTSRLAIYDPSGRGRDANLREYAHCYLPLLSAVAASLNGLGVTFTCAATGAKKGWRPADIEMAAYQWWSRNGTAIARAERGLPVDTSGRLLENTRRMNEGVALPVIEVAMRIALLMASILAGQITGSWDGDAKAMGQTLARSLEKCPPRVIVAKFGKDGWTKTTWGPPTNLDYDVLRTSSLKRPYQIVILYTIPVIVTKNRKNREEAEQDTKPSLVFKLSFKNVYEMGDDGSLRLFETLDQKLLDGSGSWKERTRLPDACWDQLPKSE